MEKDEIVFKGIISLEDKPAREWLSVIERKVDRINKRTKDHTLRIKKLEAQIKCN